MSICIERHLIAFKVTFSIRDISAPIFFPLLTKLRAALRPRLVYLIKCFIVGSNTIDLEKILSISSQSEVDGYSNIEQVIKFIINLLSQLSFNTNLSRNLIWHLFCLIISRVDDVIIISIADTTSFVSLSLNKYSSMTECHVLLDDNLSVTSLHYLHA